MSGWPYSEMEDGDVIEEHENQEERREREQGSIDAYLDEVEGSGWFDALDDR